MEQQKKGESSDDQENGNRSCTDDSTSDREHTTPISPDALIVQILARLDGPAYSQALYQDAKVSSISLVQTEVPS